MLATSALTAAHPRSVPSHSTLKPARFLLLAPLVVASFVGHSLAVSALTAVAWFRLTKEQSKQHLPSICQCCFLYWLVAHRVSLVDYRWSVPFHSRLQPTPTLNLAPLVVLLLVGWLVGCRICIDCRRVLSSLAVDNVGGSNGWYIGLVTMLRGRY